MGPIETIVLFVTGYGSAAWIAAASAPAGTTRIRCLSSGTDVRSAAASAPDTQTAMSALAMARRAICR